MPQSDPSRTEDPTGKRINKARDEGNVPNSREVSQTALLLLGVLMLWLYVGYVGEELESLFRWFLTEGVVYRLSLQNFNALFFKIATSLAIMLLPIFAVLGVVAFFATRLQVGALWSPKVLNPKFDKIFNLANGLKRMFLDMQTAMRLGKSVGIMVVIGVAVWLILEDEFLKLLPLYYQEADYIAEYMLRVAGELILYVLTPLILIAIADFAYTRWDYNENLKMTKDEVKDERKQAEGDPEVKQQQRMKMMTFMAQRMMEQVPKADVVVTNPTHIAVALRYDPEHAPAPQVLAKGANAVAERIKAAAREHGVPIRENKPLARALYKQVEIGETIPEELYQAVATILAQIFKHKKPAG